MTTNSLALRKIIVVVFALVYWSGVIINAYRVQKHIGRFPNLKPLNAKERLLWFGWLFVVTGWIGQPFFVGYNSFYSVFHLMNFFVNPPGMFLGTFIALSGYAGTLWCYSVLGDSWRIWVNKKEKTTLIKHGPYRFVRHPIYLFQMVILAGITFILPTLFSLIILAIHFCCIVIKASDEEAYLLSTHAPEYKEYYSRTGRFLPRWKTL